VVCAGEDGRAAGVPGVPVSDGERVTVTDQAGRFVLPAADVADGYVADGYVRHPIFISTPAGYRPVGDFFQHVDQDCGGGVSFRLALAPERTASGYTFAVLADYQWEVDDTMRAVFRRIISDPAGPQFIVHVGDLFYMMEGAPVRVARRYYERYRDVLPEFEIPVYNLIGNHDQVNGPPVSPEAPEFADGLYEEVLGPTYYSFDWGQVHLIVLNSFEIVGKDQHYRIAERQLRWLENDLAYQPSDKPLMLFTHRSPMQWENERDLLRVLNGRRVLACFAGDWHRDAVFRCPQEPFPTIITVGPLENVQWMPSGYRIVEVHGGRLRTTYRLMHSLDEVHLVRPVPGSHVSGKVELVVTEHLRSDRRPMPAYSTDGRSWVPLRPQPLPGKRTAGCEAYWAQWRAMLEIEQDTTVMVRAAEDSPPAMQVALPLEAVPSPLAWRRAIVQSGDTWWRSQPVVAGPLVIVGEDTGVRALRAADGEVAWEHREAAHWLGTVLVVEERVIATSWEGDVVALGLPDGRVLWRTGQECAIPPSRPCAAGRSVVVGGMKRDGIWDGSLTCLDLATGDVRWSRRYDHPFFSTPLYADGRLWAVCGDVVHCFEVASGNEIWAYRPEHFSLYGQMVFAQGRLLAPDGDGWTYVLDPESGQFLERFLMPRGVEVASDGRVLYVPCGMRGLRAYDPLSHRELWRFHRPGSYFAGTPTLRTHDLVVACSDGNVYVVDKSGGVDEYIADEYIADGYIADEYIADGYIADGYIRVTWSHQLGNVGGATVALDGERGYVITGDGELLAFHLPLLAVPRGEMRNAPD